MKTALEAPPAYSEPIVDANKSVYVAKKPFFSKIKITVISLVILGAGVLIARGFTANSGTQSKNLPRTPVLTITTVSPELKTLHRELSVHGSVSAWDPVSVGATTTANGLEVKSILVDDSDHVKKGQVLATLDSSQLVAQLDSEKARLASSLASVTKSIQPNRPEDLNSMQAAVAQSQANVADAEASLVQAEANLENARVNITRYKALSEAGVVSLQETETRDMTAKVNEAAVRSAQQKVRAAKLMRTRFCN